MCFFNKSKITAPTWNYERIRDIKFIDKNTIFPNRNTTFPDTNSKHENEKKAKIKKCSAGENCLLVPMFNSSIGNIVPCLVGWSPQSESSKHYRVTLLVMFS